MENGTPLLQKWWKTLKKEDIICFQRNNRVESWNHAWKEKKDTIHHNGESFNVELLYRIIHSENQLCVYGAVTKLVWHAGKTGIREKRKFWSWIESETVERAEILAIFPVPDVWQQLNQSWMCICPNFVMFILLRYKLSRQLWKVIPLEFWYAEELKDLWKNCIPSTTKSTILVLRCWRMIPNHSCWLQGFTVLGNQNLILRIHEPTHSTAFRKAFGESMLTRMIQDPMYIRHK